MDGIESRSNPLPGSLRPAGRGHQRRIAEQQRLRGGDPPAEKCGECPGTAQQRKGRFLGQFVVVDPRSPECGIVGREPVGLGNMEGGETQLADILTEKEFGEVVVGRLGAGQTAQGREAHAVVEPVGTADKAHGIGDGPVALAADLAEQGRHAGGVVHRGGITCGAEGPPGPYVRIRRPEAPHGHTRDLRRSPCRRPEPPRGT